MFVLMRNMLVVMLLFLSSGCTLMSPVKTETKTTYVLNTVPHPMMKRSKRQITLLVTRSESGAIYNTTEMVYAIKPYQIAYFVKNSWADSPTKMLQPLIIQTMQNTHYFHGVNLPSFSGKYDFVLNTQLLQLQQDFFNEYSVVHLTLRAQLVDAATSRVIAAKQFSVEEVAPSNNPYGGVIAANKATASILKQLAKFCLDNL